MTRTFIRRGARLTMLVATPALLGAAALAPSAVAETKVTQKDLAPVTPVHECVLKDDKGDWIAYFGYDNPNDETVVVPLGTTSAAGGILRNFFDGETPDRGQPTSFLPGRHRGVVGTPMPRSDELIWTLASDPYGPAEIADTSWEKEPPTCAPNLVISKTGPTTAEPGEDITWTITVRHAGYPDIDDAIEPGLGVPAAAIGVHDPAAGTTPLTPDEWPASGLLLPGQSLSYTVVTKAPGDVCDSGHVNEASVAIDPKYGITEARTDDNSARHETTIAGGSCDPLPPDDTPVPPPSGDPGAQAATPPLPAAPQQLAAPATKVCAWTPLRLSLVTRGWVLAGQRTRVTLRLRNLGRARARTTQRYRIPTGSSLLRRPARATVRGGWVTLRRSIRGRSEVRSIVLLRADRTASGRRRHLAIASAPCGARARAAATVRLAPVLLRVTPAVTG